MRGPRTITGTQMHEINRNAILEIIRSQSPISRTAISQKLNSSLPTVMRIVNELIEEGFVHLQGETEWSGGRRRPLLEFNAEGSVVLGIDLGGTNMFGAIANLGGTILYETTLKQHGTTDEASFQLLVELIETLLANPVLKGRKIQGIGVGAPGVTKHAEGIVQWSPSLGWQNYPLKEKLFTRFSLPIAVDNDVNLAALGELWFGAGKGVQSMVLISIGTGIGAGIVLDGALYRGINEASGEIGYTLTDRSQLGKKYLQFGSLEILASGTGIANRGRLAANSHLESKVEINSAQDVFDAARRGSSWAQTVVQDTIDYLAICIANLSSFFDPELIVFGGGVSRSADLLIEPILQRIEGATPYPIRLAASALGRRAAVMGAIAIVLHQTSDYYVLRKIS